MADRLIITDQPAMGRRLIQKFGGHHRRGYKGPKTYVFWLHAWNLRPVGHNRVTWSWSGLPVDPDIAWVHDAIVSTIQSNSFRRETCQIINACTPGGQHVFARLVHFRLIRDLPMTHIDTAHLKHLSEQPYQARDPLIWDAERDLIMRWNLSRLWRLKHGWERGFSRNLLLGLLWWRNPNPGNGEFALFGQWLSRQNCNAWDGYGRVLQQYYAGRCGHPDLAKGPATSKVAGFLEACAGGSGLGTGVRVARKGAELGLWRWRSGGFHLTDRGLAWCDTIRENWLEPCQAAGPKDLYDSLAKVVSEVKAGAAIRRSDPFRTVQAGRPGARIETLHETCAG